MEIKKENLAEFIKLYANLWSSHNINGLVELFSEDGEYHDMPTKEVIKGKKGLTEFFTMNFALFPDFKMTVQKWHAGSDFIVNQWILNATPVENNAFKFKHALITLPAIDLIEFKNGKIKKVTIYHDMSTLF